VRIAWLASAQRDLSSILAYYEDVASKEVGRRVLQRIIGGASALADNPYLGHPSASTDGVHELQVAKLPYLLPYRVVGERIEILRIFHESQGRPAIWRAE
jgi:toxin ParE1/3/4